MFSNTPPQASNPDWNPTDPTGSLYLNRMAEVTANIHHQITRRRQHQNQTGYAGYAGAADPSGDHDLSATVHFAPDNRGSHHYDRALRQSQHAALTRRKGFGMGNSFMTMSMLNAGGPDGGASVYAGGASMARSAVLGDSQGSALLTAIPDIDAQTSSANQGTSNDQSGGADTEPVPKEVGLGDSYVDGTKQAVKPYVSDGGDEDEEELEDGGMLGLLAQIYGRKDGPNVRIS